MSSLNTTSKTSEEKAKRISIRLVKNDKELIAAQNLRYRVFYQEFGAIPTDEMIKLERDFDEYDPLADHLIVTDSKDGEEKIVGTYRLFNSDAAQKHGHFYSESEFDLSDLLSTNMNLLELGRSCVMPNYRAGPVLQLLWQGIAEYINQNNIELMFGCASFHSTDIDKLAAPLSYIYHNHLAPEGLRPKAIKERYIDMNILPKDELESKAIFSDLPPLLKGYFRVGALIGDGAVIDPEFNTTDVCIVAQTNLVTARYRKHYDRKIEQEIHTKGTIIESDITTDQSK